MARRHEISTGQLYTWRSKLAEETTQPDERRAPGFAEAVMIDGADPARPSAGAVIVVDLPRDPRVSIFPAASPALATAVLKALR